MVASNLDRAVDSALILHDGASEITADALGTVGGVAAAGILDLGAVDACFDVAMNVTAMDTASTDEGYAIQVLASNSSSFASGVVLLDAKMLGTTNATTGIGSATGGLDTTKTTGLHILTTRNRIGATVYRYVRVNFETKGTTPSITCPKVWISKVHVA